jgi:predicted amidohydrolase
MPPLTITLIQPDVHWEDKAANLELLGARIDAINDKTNLVILPEMFSTGFSMRPEALAEPMDGPSVAWMKQTAARKKVILTGSLIIEEKGRYFNRLIWMLPNGQYGTYDKRHRFAYAGEHEHYTAGHKRLIASVNGWKVNLLICYDLRFPVWSRQQLQEPLEPATPGQPIPSPRKADGTLEPEYDLLIYVANWPERRSHAWKTLLQARAIENQAFVVGVNRVGNDGNNIYHSGDSMIIDPLGEVLYHAPKEESIFTSTLQPEKLEEVRTRFPFWQDADRFAIDP